MTLRWVAVEKFIVCISLKQALQSLLISILKIMSITEVLSRYIVGSYDRFQAWLNRNYTTIQPYFDITKTVLLHSLAIFLITSTCLYISAFLFGVIYHYNMPTIYYAFDLNFQYNRLETNPIFVIMIYIGLPYFLHRNREKV